MTPPETPLGRRIADLIRAAGPMTIADYMAVCLGDPAHGYYVTRDPFGTGGDFITAPEISQMFGELVGLWLADMWMQAGRPTTVRLVEIGPGRGTLMADALRALRLVPQLRAVATVHLVETSPALRVIQEKTLSLAGMPVFWHERFEDVPDGAVLVVANELFDALPIRQFVRLAGQFRERVVGVGERGQLAFGIGPGVLPEGDLPPSLRGAADGSVVEISPASVALMTGLAARIARDGIAALVIDYGHVRSGFGDTFQAMRRHGFADPLACPGEADLTAHVDFASLARAARAAGAVPHGAVEQGAFLKALGIDQRAESLMKGKDAVTAAAIAAGRARLVEEGQMGSLFKVLAVTRPGLKPAGI